MFNRFIISAFVVVLFTSCATSLHTTAQSPQFVDEQPVEALAAVLPAIKLHTSIYDINPNSDSLLCYKDVRTPIAPFTYDQRRCVLITEFRELVTFEDMELNLRDYVEEFHYPVDGYVTSPFGWRGTRMHNGVDIKAKRGDKIYASFDGVVRFAKYNGAYGYCVVIRHYNGLETLYAHASKIWVEENQKVSSGDVIALAGRTGRASGDHLHFEVRVAGQCVDPNLLVNTKQKTIQDKNLYFTMSGGKIYGSNSDLASVREAEIREATSIKYHVVRKGDTLSQIAVRNHTTVSRICALNRISSKSIIKLNQRLRVQ